MNHFEPSLVISLTDRLANRPRSHTHPLAHVQLPEINHHCTWKHILSQFRALFPGMIWTSPRLVFESPVSPLHASQRQPRYRAAWNISIKCSHLNAGHDCCSHWLARLQQTGPLSLALHLFSRPTPRVSQKGRLTSFRGMLPSNLVINFPWIDTKPVFQRGHKVTAEMSLRRNSPEAFFRQRENHTGKEGKILSDLSPPTQLKVASLASFPSPLTCCFQWSFCAAGP